MNLMKEAALDYAALGWAIFPTNSNKEPLIEGGVNCATTNAGQIEKWWDRWPKANIALNVGDAHMMVLDLDPGHSLGELETNVGKLPPTALAATTPRGGRHLFYSLGSAETVPPSASKVANHVDVRSFHSYVLLAPSKTRDGCYTWDTDPRHDESAQPAHRTTQILDAACKVKERDVDHDNWLIEPDLPQNIELAVNWLKHDARVAISGMNGDQMAYSTAAMCKSYGLSPEMALDLMWDHWNPRCLPPWGSDEIDHLEQKVINGYEYNTSPPGNMTPSYKTAKAHELFSPVSRSTTGGGEEIKAGRFRMVDYRGMREIKPPKWLIKDTIPENSYSLLIGPRGTFKTFIALDMALSVATGAPYDDWLGCWPEIDVSGPVLFAAGEGRGNIKNRVMAWADVHNDGEEINDFYLIDPVPSPTTEDVTPFIEMALQVKDKYALVVLDTVGRSMQGLNENSQQDASTFTRMVETIQAELGCAVLAIHHSGHDNAQRGRGSSVFGADVDAEFVLKRNGKDTVVQLTNSKQKDAPEWEKPRVIELRKHNNSLVAVTPSKAAQAQATTQAKSTGRKTRYDKEVSIKLVAKAAYQFLKSCPAKTLSKRQLAEAIAADESIPMGYSAIYQNYMGDLLIDKAHPLFRCYDKQKQNWSYNP